MTRSRCLPIAVAALAWVAGAGAASAKVVALQVTERVDLPVEVEGFRVPAYEKLSGTVVFGVDPKSPYNRAIADLLLAETGESGWVEARANFMVLRPKRAEDARGIGFLEVSNRGGKASLRYFDNASASSADPSNAEHLGDGLLLRLGLTVIWVGWQFDVPRSPGALALEAPRVSDRGRPVFGWVRSDWVVDEPTAVLALGHRGHRAYPPAVDLEGHRLTVRAGRDSERVVVPREEWSFDTIEGGPDSEGAPAIRLRGGFDAGKIYELVYLSGEPRVVGMGLAAVRDMMSYAKYDPACPFPVAQGIGFGVSQTGRFLRHFLYQGFNADEDGRKVFDGLLIHTAGAGRGSFNHRFAQPSRDAHRYSAFFYPTDIFPFSTRTQEDSLTGKRDGLLAVYDRNLELVPKIFTTNTGYEYWGRAAALIHTTPDGSGDVAPVDSERIYHLSSAQHFVDRWPIPPGARVPGTAKMPAPYAFVGDPVDLLVPLRALLMRLVSWVKDGTAPPPSRYPKLEDGTLVPFESWRFPNLRDVVTPLHPHTAYRAEYGPNFALRGIAEIEPPRRGPAFPSLVPAVEERGNEVAGVRAVEVAVPVATYTPWSLRYGLANPREMTDFRGLTIPFAVTAAAKKRNGDPRSSLDELYPSEDAYRERVKKAIDEMVAAGLMLEEDRGRVEKRTAELWSWVVGLEGAR